MSPHSNLMEEHSNSQFGSCYELHTYYETINHKISELPAICQQPTQPASNEKGYCFKPGWRAAKR
jgi:hypothetical protein